MSGAFVKASPPLPPADLAHVLAHTRELWEEARGQAFFITGGTGFFGMWLLESFIYANEALDLGARAVILTRNPAKMAEKAPHLATRADLEFVTGDVRNFSSPIGQFTFVVHAATSASANANDEESQDMLDTIIGGTRRVLDFAAQKGVKKLLLTSSGAAYGIQPAELSHIPEDYAGAPSPLQASSAYGIGKRVAEHMAAVSARRFGFEAKIARCFAFVGPHLPLDAHFAVGNFIRDGLAGKSIEIRGDGSPQRSYLYAADLTVWLWTILFRGKPERIYNVGSERAVSLRELAEIVSSVFGGQISISVANKAQQVGPIARYVPAVARAQAELGVNSHTNLAEAIGRTVSWHTLH